MSKKILITAGGTGGHVFPALSLGKQLAKTIPSIELLYVGGKLSLNKYFEKGVFPFKSVSCGSLSSKNPFILLNSVGEICQGIWESRQIIKSFAPDLIVGFGSYYTFPTLLAGKLCSIPIVLHEANSIPGKVNRLLSKQAIVTGIHFPETASLLKGKAVEVGMPLRDGYHQGSYPLELAKAHFQLNPECLTLLVFGGSQGARSINSLFSQAICHLKYPKNRIQVLHFTGNSETTEEMRSRYTNLGIKAIVKDFELRMDLAWQASDLMISRSGAGTIAEQMEFEVPGILIPFPFATDKHQDKNAEFMVRTVGGAIKLDEEGLDGKGLAAEIDALLDSGKLMVMRNSMHLYKMNARRTDLCKLIIEILQS